MIRVFVVDDHDIVRAGLRHLVSEVPGMTCCGEAAEATEAIEKTQKLVPDVVVLDVSLPGATGTRLVEQLRALPRPPRIVVFTMYPEDVHAVPFLNAGAGAFLNKRRPSADLVSAIRTVYDRGRYITPELEEFFFENQINPTIAPHASLSERETHVLRELAGGRRSVDIAEDMGIAVSTVNTFVQRIKGKLGVRTLVDLARYARDHGLVE